MIDPLKTISAFPIYLAPSFENGRLGSVLEELGLHGIPLSQVNSIVAPALVVLAPGEAAPEGLEESTVRPPVDAPPAALREILRVALQNAELREQARRQHRQFEELNRIGIALSAERDIVKLQEFILTTMRQLTNADGASLWLKTVEDGAEVLFLASSQNHSLDKDTYQKFTVPVDEKSVVGYTVTQGKSQIYDDAYNPPPGKPQGGRGFDAQFGYRTKSMLTVPMRDYNHAVVGAIQLINAKRRFETKLTIDTVDEEVVSFRPEDLEMLESVASQAAVALDNKNLLDEIQNMFEGFVTASITAIEQRDPSTAGHSGRVERLTTGIARGVNEIAVGKFRDRPFNEDEFKELRYACLLHDFGKVGVHEDVLVKEKKLPLRQLDVIQARFEFVQRSVQVRYANDKLEVMKRDGPGSPALADLDRRLEEDLRQLRMWLDAIVVANEPSVLPEDKASTLEVLARKTYQDLAGVDHPMLDPHEFRFLSIPKGTLDEQERLEIESHVTHSFVFLSKIRWTQSMLGIPQIAYGHHEKLDGSGYPRHLKGHEIPLQTKMMTIADIYDALTASDRPYKPAVPVARALDILRDEADAGKLDRDLLDLFTTRRIYELTAAR